METTKLACNYAIIRFLPYPETEEFVNVGVVLSCPSKRFFGFRLETAQRRRVTGFFPELDKAIFVQGRGQFRKELERIRTSLDASADQPLLPFAEEEFSRAFQDVVKVRESIFRFSGVGTRLAEDPESALDKLFEYYVERSFTQAKEYQETVMTGRLRASLRQAHVTGYRSGHLGDELYQVPFPLLRQNESGSKGAFRAIRPLDLAKKDTTAIVDHGDEWLAKLGHLKDMDFDVGRILFVVQMPDDEPANMQVAKWMLGQIEGKGVQITRFGDMNRITEFAKAG